MPGCRSSQCVLISFPRPAQSWKQPEKVFGGRGGDFIRRDVEESGQGPGGLGHQGRLVALAAMRGGSEPGRVGFHQNPVQWHAGGHVAQRLRLGVGEIAGKGDQKAKVERAPRLLPTAAETVHDAAQAG